jgi:hypothetical protein
MALQSETRRACGAAGPLDAHSLAAVSIEDIAAKSPAAQPSDRQEGRSRYNKAVYNGSQVGRNGDPAPKPRAIRGARLALLREAIFEACGFVHLHAEPSFGEAGDDPGLLYSLKSLVGTIIVPAF